MLKQGDPAERDRQGEAKIIAADFVADHVAHCCMEPLNATALVDGDHGAICGRRTSRSSTCSSPARLPAAPSRTKVKVERPFLGGGFGRRTDWDVAFEAVALAKTMPGKPIKVIWSREDDVTQDMWRPLAAQRIEVGLDDKGKIVGWRHRIVAASYMARAIPPLFKKIGGKDPVSAVRR